MVLSKEFTSILLSLLLELSSLQFSEVSGVAEDLDEGFLSEGLLRSLL